MFTLKRSSYGCKLATYLDPLVGVAHHGDEEVDEDDDGDEEVDEEDDLEEHDRPLAQVRAQLQVLGAAQAGARRRRGCGWRLNQELGGNEVGLT